MKYFHLLFVQIFYILKLLCTTKCACHFNQHHYSTQNITRFFKFKHQTNIYIQYLHINIMNTNVNHRKTHLDFKQLSVFKSCLTQRYFLLQVYQPDEIFQVSLLHNPKTSKWILKLFINYQTKMLKITCADDDVAVIFSLLL